MDRDLIEAHWDRLPVIVGVGSFTHRPVDLSSTLEPAEVIATAISRALADAGLGERMRGRVDGLFLSHLDSWRYRDALGAVSDAAGLTPACRHQAPSGGDQPTRHLARAAAAVARGELSLAVVAGGEAARSRRRFEVAGSEPDWPTPAPQPAPRVNGLRAEDRVHGITSPSSVYPLFEVARRAAYDATPDAGQQRSASIQARLSEIACHVEGAWSQTPYAVEDVLTPTPRNRWVSWPYTRLMCANPAVDQAGAAIVTTLGFARRHGLADPLIHVWGDASGADAFTVLTRESLGESEGLAETLSGAAEIARLGIDEFDHVEFYSCFPVVPWAASAYGGVPPGRDLSVTGGLTFYGGPASSYMNCAITAMVRELRSASSSRIALVHGNGLFMTKHHAVVLSTDPPPGLPDLGDGPDAPPGPGAGSIRLTYEPVGDCELETCTVLSDADGEWVRGIVVARDAAGARFVANTPSDHDHFVALTDLTRHPVGLVGKVTRGGAGTLVFALTGERKP